MKSKPLNILQQIIEDTAKFEFHKVKAQALSELFKKEKYLALQNTIFIEWQREKEKAGQLQEKIKNNIQAFNIQIAEKIPEIEAQNDPQH